MTKVSVSQVCAFAHLCKSIWKKATGNLRVWGMKHLDCVIFLSYKLGQIKRTPLHLAAKNGNADVCRLLVENHAKLDLQDYVSQRDK